MGFGTLKKLVTEDLLFEPCLKDLEGSKELAEKHFDDTGAQDCQR